MTLPITIIIPTMNRPKSLKETLSSFLNSNDIPSQIIVVDQSKDSETKKDNEIIVGHFSEQTEMVYVYLEKASITKARNAGLHEAVNDVVIFSDDDVVVEKETFSYVYQIMNDNNVAMVGGFDKNTPPVHKRSFLSYVFARASYSKRKYGHVSAGMYGNFPIPMSKWNDTEWAMGFFFVIRKSLADKWKLRFDEKLLYYAYAEDLDFTYAYYKKAKAEDLKCGMSLLLSVYHNCSQEYRVPKLSATMMEILHRHYILNKFDKSLQGRFLVRWCDFGLFVNRLIYKRRPMDVIKSIIYLDKNHKDIMAGNFHYERFM